jgi:hypothetical protein
MIESHAPRHPNWTDELIEDWLYGDLTQQLEAKLNNI